MKLNTQKAAPASIVLPHFIFAAVSFLVLTILMFFSAPSFIGHYFNPQLLCLTHIAALGWGTMIIFGALYQLLPVLLNSPLFSNNLALATFYFWALGLILLAYSFWTFSIGLPMQSGAILLLTGASLFLINIVVTATKAGKLNTESEFIVTAGIWFWLTTALGCLMAFNFMYAFLPEELFFYLKLHAHIGIAGWLLLLIMGVSSKLIPMFLLSPTVNSKKLKYAYVLINSAIIGFLTDALFFEGITRGFVYLVIAIIGILFFLSFIFEAYKKRARKGLDIGMKHTFYAFILIGLPIILSILNSTEFPIENSFALQISIAFGVSVFIGFISFLILGQTFKTLPFIIWLDKYQKLVGKGKTPLPKDLYSEKIATLQFYFFIVAFFMLMTGILFASLITIQVACLLLIITALLYNFNVFKMFLHKTRTLQ